VRDSEGREKSGKDRRAKSACPRDERGKGEGDSGRASMIVVAVTAI